jgi:linoleoyl-CoA desaturase
MATESFSTLLAIVRERGFQGPKAARTLGEVVSFVGMTLGGIAVFLLSNNLAVKAGAMFISTCGCLGISTIAHTSSHYTAFNKRWMNKFLTYFGYPFFFGVSATYWWNKHCVVHHPAPNLIGKDDDIDLAPFFAITEDQFNRGPLRFLHRVQWLITPIALSLNEFNIQRSGWVFLIKKLRNPREREAAHWIDLATLLSHWTTWVLLPMLFFSPLDVVGFYALRMMLMGYAMFIGFAPAHFPEEAVAAEAHQKTAGFILRQTATTVNFRTGRFGALLCGGVEYQIEHHLFPWIPPSNYPELSRIVSEFCRQHGYPYRTLGWAEATWKSLVVFYRPKRVLAQLDECMDRAEVPPRAKVPSRSEIPPFVVGNMAAKTQAVSTLRRE